MGTTRHGAAARRRQWEDFLTAETARAQSRAPRVRAAPVVSYYVLVTRFRAPELLTHDVPAIVF